MLETKLHPRMRDYYGGDDLEPVWSGASIVKRVANAWRFPF